MKIISVRQNPEYAEAAITYFQSKWAGVYTMVYDDAIRSCIDSNSPLPQWYLLVAGFDIIGCVGLTSNDFIGRMDRYPWLCALYIEKNHRGYGYAELLIEKCKFDCAMLGYPSLYLCSDFVDYFEKYGFTPIGTGYHPWRKGARVFRTHINVNLEIIPQSKPLSPRP